jgi:hypothetical protein
MTKTIKSRINLLLLLGLLLTSSQLMAAKTYTIEVLAFSQSGQSTGGEWWPSDPGQPNLHLANTPRSLGSSSKRLSGIASRLSKKAGYRVLLHQAWRQTVISPKNAKPLRLTSGSALDGTIKVSVKRYLHVDLDLLLKSGKGYRLQSKRRMRSKEIHYIDHPMMGVLVLITPVGKK